MQKWSKRKKKNVKVLSMGLAGLLIVSAGLQYVTQKTIPVSAAKEDTLPGVESIREEYITTGETFQILEIAPDVSAGEIGYYVGGQEPLPSLVSEEPGKWLSWREKLATLETQAEREAFMEALEIEAKAAADAFSGKGTAPYKFQNYKELSYASDDAALKDGASYLDVEEEVLRGYFQSAEGEDAQWNVVFERVRDNITVEEVNTGKDTPYYRVTAETQLTGLDLKDMAENVAQADTAIYLNKGTYYEYAGTAAAVWVLYSEQIKDDTVSDGDVGVPDDTVSDGDEETPDDTVSDSDAELPDDNTGNDTTPETPDHTVSGNGTETYANTASTDVSSNDTVSGSDGEDSGGEDNNENTGSNEPETPPVEEQPPVEELPEILKDPTDYYIATFSLINNVPENQITMDKMVAVYVADVNRSYHVKSGGNYKVVITEKEIAAGENYSIPAERVYYKGGIQSKEVLRNMAFGMTDEDAAAIRIRVDTYTPAMVNLLSKEELAQYDMLYIGNAALWNSKSTIQLSYHEDITAQHLEYLASHVVTSKIPCIVDISEVILKGTERNTWLYKGESNYPNLDKLILLLLSTNKDRFFVDNEDGNHYNTLHADFKKEYTWNSGAAGFTLTDIVEKDGEAGNEALLAVDGQNGDLHFVKENVWAFYGKEHPIIRNGFGDSLYDAEKEVPFGFQAVLDEIVTENLYRGADISAKPLAEEVHDGTVMRYLLNYQKRRTITQKVGVHILEIQPATKVSALNDTIIAEWLGIDPLEVSKKEVTITTMPITQFIGSIEDLNDEYDLIYFGDAIDGFYTQEVDGQTITDYNDDIMDGLLYCHVGDKITTQRALSGLLDTEIGYDKTRKAYYLQENSKQRYSGNDITVEKYNALMDYIDAGYPIVVANSLVNVTTNGTEMRHVNGDRIDNSSYLYEFLQNAFQPTNGKTYKNIFRVSDVADGRNSDFNFYINRAKLKMEEMELIGAEKYNADTNNVVMSIDKQVDGKYYLRSQFKVQNVGAVSPNTEYTCRMYLDSNADGKFSTKNEELSALEITNTATGERVNSTSLKAGETYIVSRQIPDGYMGCVTWKLEIQQSNNALIRTARIGYVKLKNETPTVIRILQIYFHSDREANLILADKIGSLNHSKTDYQSGTGLATSNFYQLTHSEEIKKEYLLDITSISRTDFESYIANGITIDDTIVDVDSWLGQFDMLIVGFSDAYNGSVDNDWSAVSVDKIKEFINSGRSVLLSHDMTSIVNAPPEVLTHSGKPKYNYTENGYISIGSVSFPEWYWGYNMNRYFRNMLGMDMYGITMSYSGGGDLYEPLQSGDGLGEGIKEGAELFASLRRWANPKTGRYEEYNIKELAYTPKSGRTTTVSEVQGYSYMTLSFREAVNITQHTYREGIVLTSGTNKTKETKLVSKTNEGQITNYPYYIEDTISVAPTHSQYYTLDMNSDSDNDKQTDLVVWYCLDGTTSGGSSYYAKSYQDIRNNYYIYNKGNITYTGMGHHANGKGSNLGQELVTVHEAKLFINTMIASYQAGKKSPHINMTDSVGTQIDTIYHFYEDSATPDEEEKVRIYYSLQDLNMVSGVRTMEVKYFVEDQATATPDNVLEECPVRELTGLLTYDTSGRVVDASKLQVDTTYYVEIPASYLASSEANGNQIEFFIGSKTLMTTTSINDGSTRTEESAWGYGGISYLNCDLMELD